MPSPTWPRRLQALSSKQRARLRCRAGLVYQRGGASIAPYAHHSHATSQTGRSAADPPDGVTLTRRREPFVFVASAGHDGLPLSLNTCVRHLGRTLLGVVCRLLFGAQSQPLVELLRNSPPNGSEVFTSGRWQPPRQDVARCFHDKFDVQFAATFATALDKQN